MKVVLPIAGRGTRLSPLTDNLPKALVTVAGDTLLGHALDPIKALGPDVVEEIVLVVGHHGEMIEPWYRQRYQLPVHIAEQPSLSGQAGALACITERLTGPILILFCDTLHDADLKSLASMHKRNNPPDGILHVKAVKDPSRFGVAVVNDGGYVKRIVEKPDHPVSDLAIVGVYWIRDGERLAKAVRTLLDHGEMTRGEYYLADALQIMIEDGARFETRTIERWLDCGTLESLQEVESVLLAERTEPAVRPTIE